MDYRSATYGYSKHAVIDSVCGDVADEHSSPALSRDFSSIAQRSGFLALATNTASGTYSHPQHYITGHCS